MTRPPFSRTKSRSLSPGGLGEADGLLKDEVAEGVLGAIGKGLVLGWQGSRDGKQREDGFHGSQVRLSRRRTTSSIRKAGVEAPAVTPTVA